VSWVLVFVLLHADGTTTKDVTKGIESQAACDRLGQARIAQANHREGTTDVATFWCRRREPEKD